LFPYYYIYSTERFEVTKVYKILGLNNVYEVITTNELRDFNRDWGFWRPS